MRRDELKRIGASFPLFVITFTQLDLQRDFKLRADLKCFLMLKMPHWEVQVQAKSRRQKDMYSFSSCCWVFFQVAANQDQSYTWMWAGLDSLNDFSFSPSIHSVVMYCPFVVLLSHPYMSTPLIVSFSLTVFSDIHFLINIHCSTFKPCVPCLNLEPVLDNILINPLFIYIVFSVLIQKS